METMLFLAGAFVAAKIGGLALARVVKNDPFFDHLELSPAIVVAYLLGAIKVTSAIGVLVGGAVFHQEIFAMAKAFVGWPA